jgi:dTDP-4-dehydrorhamnose 3,5-epimerase
MQFEALGDSGLVMIQPEILQDGRGCFAEVLRKDELAEHGIATEFVQENFSRSQRGVLRGLHYQHPRAQGKLIRCLSGAIFDVAVDLRRASEGFGRWVAVEIHAGGHHSLWIPPGFAHGFYALTDQVEIAYHCTDYYVAEQSQVLAWDDPELGIEWPFLADDGDEGAGSEAPVLSAADRSGVALADARAFEEA